MEEIIVDGYECQRCNHKWTPRLYKKQIPVVCPKCKSPYWNKQKRKKC